MEVRKHRRFPAKICESNLHHRSSPVGSKVAEKECVTAPAQCGCVEIRGARQNNLKGIDVDLPLGQMTVITGPSGSGKSSLAFDTIYAEGQRRYVETFSPYMRQFLDRMDKPRVDEIRGIPPAIAIEQANPVKSSRSTVGTMTEINDYLKLLWPRMARAFCPGCGREIKPETAKSIADEVMRECAGQNILLTFWVGVPAKTEPADFFNFLQQQGYLRVWIDGQVMRTDAAPKSTRLGARVQVIQDRITISAENRGRLTEAIEIALRFGKDRINVIPAPEVGNVTHPARSSKENPAAGLSLRDGLERATPNAQRSSKRVAASNQPSTLEHRPFSTGWHCAHCDIDIRPPTPGLFSFNNPLGACPQCRGFGRTIAIDLNKAIPDRSLSIAEGAVRVFRGQEFGESQKDLLRACAREEIDIKLPFEELPQCDQDFVIKGEKGDDDEEYEDDTRWYGVRGFFRWLESNTYKMHVRVLLSRYRAYTTCPGCHGGRFQPETLNYKIAGRRSSPPSRNGNGGSLNGGQEGAPTTLPEFDALSISEAREVLQTIELPASDSTAGMLRDEICARLSYLCEVGLGYLTLDRSTRTLSGGEVQRVNLTTCLGASLVNTLFVMDEPSVGLHPRDVGHLIRVMHNLRDKGNTLLVVEHEEAIIRSADNLLDIGPGRGERGGELVFNGPLQEFLGGSQAPSAMPDKMTPRSKKSRLAAVSLTSPAERPIHQSLTRGYLTGEKSIPIPKSRRKSSSFIRITGAREHNLKNLNVDIPLGLFTCVTGVSGSGKSTLIHDVFYRNLIRAKGQTSEQEPGACKSLTGAHRVGDVVMVDQSQLARTPRSTPR